MKFKIMILGHFDGILIYSNSILGHFDCFVALHHQNVYNSFLLITKSLSISISFPN